MSMLDDPFAKVRPKLVAARIEFMAELARFQAGELTRRPTPGEWSPLEVAYHLYVVEGLSLQELRRVQEEENPQIVALEEEGPRLTRESAANLSLDAVLAGLAARREELFEYLAQLPPTVWNAPATIIAGARCASINWSMLCSSTIENTLAS